MVAMAFYIFIPFRVPILVRSFSLRYFSKDVQTMSKGLIHIFPAVVCFFYWHFLSLIISGTACLLFCAATRNSPLNSWSLRSKTADDLAM